MPIREYSDLGRVLADIAHKRGADGGHRIAHYIEEKTGKKRPTGSAWSQVLTGNTKRPNPKNIALFAEAFELDAEERDRLFQVFFFGEYE